MILKDLTGKIRRFVAGRLAALSTKGNAVAGIGNHCLHLYPPEPGSTPTDRTMAVFYSGDGGWARLTTHVSKRLQSSGIPVAGIDCMHYFWNEKTAESAAGDLAALIDHFSAEWQAGQVVLLGYSMGADVLPQIIQKLPQSTRVTITHVVLMSPSHYGCLKFRFIGWLGFETPSHYGRALQPDIDTIAPIPVTFFAGERETTSLAHSLTSTANAAEFLPGGHHYGSDYETLADRVLVHINRPAHQRIATSH
ncbi:MAG: AcvB/VirJ family lysyl-phosphatidylglycerol hydrolase [Verrucomicrobiales bacterium]